MLTLLLSLALAFAQDPAPPTAPAAAVAPVGPQKVWALRDIESARFPDVDVVGPIFEQGEGLEVLVSEPDRLRVRYGDRYGWVPLTAVTTEAPAAPTLDLGALGFDVLGAPQLPGPAAPEGGAR